MMDEHQQTSELTMHLETALHRLVESFWDEPYRFFTEADAVAALQSWVAKRPELARVVETADGFKTGLLHREYPTFFRFKKREPAQRLGPPARRGHYDLALLDPSYIQVHDAETVINRSIGNQGDLSRPPLLAAVEFKFFTQGWSPRRVRGVEQDLGKLRLALQSPPDAHASYLCIFQRDITGTASRWDRHWLGVEEALGRSSKVRTVVAVCWLNQERDPLVRYGGPWITTATG